MSTCFLSCVSRPTRPGLRRRCVRPLRWPQWPDRPGGRRRPLYLGGDPRTGTQDRRWTAAEVRLGSSTACSQVLGAKGTVLATADDTTIPAQGERKGRPPASSHPILPELHRPGEHDRDHIAAADLQSRGGVDSLPNHGGSGHAHLRDRVERSSDQHSQRVSALSAWPSSGSVTTGLTC